MSGLTILPILIFLSALAYYGTWHRYIISGGVAAINDALTSPTLTLTSLSTSTTGPLLRTFTGIPALDHLLSFLILTFHPCINGTSPSAALYCFHFAGQILPIATILYTDSLRAGNARRWWLSPTAWILLAQLVAMANAIPWCVALHVMTSPIVSRRLLTSGGPVARKANLIKDPASVLLLPVSIFLGHVLPCIGMALRSISGKTTQLWIVIWQPFPVLIALSQLALLPIASGLGIDTLFRHKSPERAHLFAIRVAYGCAFVGSALTHLFTILLTGLACYVPEMFANGVSEHLVPQRVLMPRVRYDYSKIQGPGQGAEAILDFLQWDQVVAGGTVLLWSVVSYVRVKEAKRESVNWLCYSLLVIAGVFAFGPGGAAAIVMWAKEENLFAQRADDDVIKKSD